MVIGIWIFQVPMTTSFQIILIYLNFIIYNYLIIVSNNTIIFMPSFTFLE
jgi:hypothetical protein